ncbi:hypothetical protein A9Q81_22765 [Gammaproteobacteria bacterium 42_54_T18]|nr:hypothetical protein A9Q81_22765 [Gammaproteobacteria bacterium 42_54_T18]
MKKLSVADSLFLRVERCSHPMHFGTLQIYRYPDGDAQSYIEELVHYVAEIARTIAPFNQRLRPPRYGIGLPSWEVDDNIDIDHHIRQVKLSGTDKDEQLIELTSRLHSSILDRSRPLWECTLIDGLDGGRFGAYWKFHHAYWDGVSALNTMDTIILSKKPDSLASDRIMGVRGNNVFESEKRDTVSVIARKYFHSFSQNIKSIQELSHNNKKVKRRRRKVSGAKIPGWYTASSSFINSPVSKNRRIATVTFSLSEFKYVATNTKSSINDVILAVSGGALRRLLVEKGLPLDKSLIVSVPVSLRKKSSQVDTGNAISDVLCEVGSDIRDPVERLSSIHSSMIASKRKLVSLSKTAIRNYTLITSFPFALSQIFGLTKGIPIPYNFIVSNVVGSEEPLYLNGAKLESFYSPSLLFQMQCLNITVVSYAGKLNFSLTACRDTLPDLDNLASYIRQEFSALLDSVQSIR